ncbi:MAG: Leu/Phe/Val dehydrogenase [Gammaproteobacteria bacterium]
MNALDDEIISYMKQLRFGDIHFKIDHATGLIAIIAIHNTTLGPALGGCRLREYPTLKDAIFDALRLAQGMSYKAAAADLPLGGGKSVILKPKHMHDRTKFFEAFGKFVEEMNGRYITAVDSGTSTTDMDNVSKHTKYVTSLSSAGGDPSPSTARGIFRAIQAGVEFKLNKNSLDGVHVAIQGVGHVGYHLAKLLHEQGAKISVADINQVMLQKCVDEFDAKIVSPDLIHNIECDVFSPCALGAVINDLTIPQIKASIIIGAANNQLAEPKHGKILFDREVLYGPDYVINSGGLIHAAAEYFKTSFENANKQIDNIYNISLNIFERSARENLPTSDIANIIAEEKIYKGD